MDNRDTLLPRLILSSWFCLFCSSAMAEGGVVHVYNWSDYIAEDLIGQFEEETGIRIVYDVFDSNATLEAKLLLGKSGYDVVVPSANFLKREARAGAFQPLDKSRLSNISNLWDEIYRKTEMFDPGGTYSVNYMWGTTGIGYSPDAVKARLGTETIDSWSVIFDPATLAKFSDCGVYLLDTPGAVMPPALNFLGLDPGSQDRADLERAAALITEIRPYIAKFDSSGYVDALASGEICLALGWSGDVLLARDRAEEAGTGVRVEYAIPKEGGQMWFDQMAIPKDAPNPEAAYRFIDFMLRPEAIAAASNYVHYANGNKASQALLDPDVIGDPAIYPPPETMARLFVVPTPEPDIMRLMTRLWTRIKSGT